MKVVFYLTILVFSISNICFSQGRGDQIFDESFIHEIRITTELEINDLFTIFFAEIGTEEYSYALSSVTLDGNILDSIGVRVKGGISSFDSKKPLKLDFNKFVSGQRYDGLKKLNLHQGNLDPSFIRETLSYGLFRNAGVKTVRTSFAKVYFNENYEGIYTIVEQIDDNFIHNRFASNNGALYKTGFMGLAPKYEVNNPLPYEVFETTITQIPTSLLHEQLSEYLDIESFLRFFALEVFVNAVDGPLTVDINYYIYYEPTEGTYVYIPWDYNLSLYGWTNHPLFANSGNFLFNRALNNPALKQRYLDIFCDLLAYNFDENRLQNLITTYQELLKDEVPNDPYIALIGNWEAGIQTIRNVITSRVFSLTAEVNENVNACNPLSNSIAPMEVVINEIVASNDKDSGIKDPNGDTADWIELYNNTSSDKNLSGYYLSNDKDVLKHWRFPENSTIAANDYLIVWADRDVDEDGLHTDFKLSKVAGEVYLSFENGEIVDEVVFTNQSTNIGFARVPNGIGDFKKQEASHNASNDLVLSNNNTRSKLEWSISPNPLHSNNIIQIHCSNSKLSKASLMDINGNLIWQSDLHLSRGINKIDLPPNSIRSGLYNLQLFDHSTKEISNQKLIVIE